MVEWFEQLDSRASATFVHRFMRPRGRNYCHLNSALCLVLYCIVDGAAVARDLSGLVDPLVAASSELRNGLPIACATLMAGWMRGLLLLPEVVDPSPLADAYIHDALDWIPAAAIATIHRTFP